MRRVFVRIPVLRFLPLLFLALLTFLLTSPLWQQAGIPDTADAHHHLPRSAAMQLAFEQGVFWPRWFPDSNYGRGEPTFHYYSPGLYWLVGAVHWAGIALDQALTLVVTAAFVLSGYGVYGWLRHVFSRTASLVSAAVYLGMPHFYSRTFLQTGDYPQLLAILIFPVILWAFTSLYFRFSIRFFLLAVTSLAGLVVCHQQQALIGAGALLLNTALLAAGYRKKGGLAGCALAALLGILLAAGYWMPALGDLPFAQIRGEFNGREFRGIDFLSWATLLSAQPFVWDLRAGNPLAGPHNTFGFAQWLLAFAGLAGTLIWSRDRVALLWCSAGIICTLAVLLITTPFAIDLWRRVPLFSILQFPFRLLPAAVLGVLPAAAAAVDFWPARLRLLAACAALVTALAFPFPYLFPALASHTTILSTADQATDVAPRRNPGVWHFLPRTTEWGAPWEYQPEGEPVKLSWRSPHEAVADVSGQPEPALLWMHFHPGWGAGNQAELRSNQAGWAEAIDISNPELPLVLRWEGTVWQRRGEQLSLLALIACLGATLYVAVRRRRKSRPETTTGDGVVERSLEGRSIANQWALIGLVTLLVAARYSISFFDAFPFLYDSPPGQLAFETDGQPATVGDTRTGRVTLLGWDLISGDAPKPGDIIVLRLYWQPHEPLNENLHTNVHLFTPSLRRSWAVESRGVYRAPTTVWSPEQYYVETMHLYVPLDAPPVPYSLAAGMATASGERLPVAGSEDGLAPLRTLTVSPLRAGLLQRIRPGIAAPADTADSLRIQGYDLAAAREGVSLRLFFETVGAVEKDWIVYIHLHDSKGERIDQFDGPPLAGLKPTSEWNRRALYIDRHQIRFPPGMLPGEYTLRIGLYDRESGERLSFLPGSEGRDHFEDGQLRVPLSVAAD